MSRAGLLLVAAIAAAPRVGRAETAAPPPTPDPAVDEAGDANLEPTSARRGIMITFAGGAAISVGFGMANATGQGGAGTLRLGHVATPRTVIGIEIVGSALFFDVDGEQDGDLYRTDSSSVLVSGQYYVNQALWVRGGVGAGRYFGKKRVLMQNGGEIMVRDLVNLAGPAGSVGVGVDLVRLKRLRASFEFSSTAMANREGVLLSNGFLLGLTID